MGCSPSKGKMFSTVPCQNNAPTFETQEGNDLPTGEMDDKSKTGTISGEEETSANVKEKSSLLTDVICDSTNTVEEGITKIEENVLSPEENKGEEPYPCTIPGKGDERRKKNKGGRRSKQKGKLPKSSRTLSKIDLPEEMVKAHQSAYAYLNPNISKYETLLGLLDQATQTYHSLQPMVALIILRYEEVIQVLEEIANEGEQMLEQHWDHMAWPTELRNIPLNSSKSSVELNSSEPPPDLLQQMLRHSTEKMRLVGDSVKKLGDSAMEDASEYFESLSKLLSDKLVVKRATEGRLHEVLAHVEAAAIRTPSPEDSALHSEDSGIGADNECHNGSKRHRKHRKNCGSGDNTIVTSGSFPKSSVTHSALHGEEDLGDEDDEEDGDEDDGDNDDADHEVAGEDDHVGEDDWSARKISSQPQVDSNLYSPNMTTTNIQNLKSHTYQREDRKRPKTADTTIKQRKLKHPHLRGLQRSRSLQSIPSQMEGPMFFHAGSRDFNHKSKLISKGLVGGREGGGSLARARLKGRSFGEHTETKYQGLRYGSKGPFSLTLSHNPLPSLNPEPPGRYAVKRLINTFSQRVDDKASQRPAKQYEECNLPTLCIGRASFVKSCNSSHNSSSPDFPRVQERPDDLDVDSLPPPPPEVLMDNSFESKEGHPGGEHEEALIRSQLTQREKSRVSQRLRTSLQSVTVLLGQGVAKHGSLGISPARPVRQDDVLENRTEQDIDQQAEIDSEREEAAFLYQQSCKIIHLHNSSDSPVKTGPASQAICKPQSRGNVEHHDDEPANYQPNSCPPTTPPVSRTRLPPFCPSVHHTIPNPPTSRQQPTPPSTGSLTRSHWRAPSPSTSTSVQRWTRGDSEEENGLTPIANTKSFCEARSVFCQVAQSKAQIRTPSCTSTLPRPWGNSSKGRLPTACLSQTFIKHRTETSVHNTSSKAQSRCGEPIIIKQEGNEPSLLTEDESVENQSGQGMGYTTSNSERCIVEKKHAEHVGGGEDSLKED